MLRPCAECEDWDEEVKRCGKEKCLPELTNCIRIKALEEYVERHTLKD